MCRFFYLNCENADRRAVAIVQAWSLIESRMRAALAGIDIGLEFVSGNELDEASSQQIRADMIGRWIPDDRYWPRSRGDANFGASRWRRSHIRHTQHETLAMIRNACCAR